VGSPARKPRPTRVQIANNSAVGSDTGKREVAQKEPIGPPPIDPPGPPRPAGTVETTPKDTASSPTPQSAAEPSGESPASSFDSANEDTEPSSPRFANGDLLAEHFAKHMYDFDAETPSEYDDLAAQFLTNQNNPDVLELTRPDGDVVKFNPNTNEFGILSGDGNVRTYLRLDERSHDYPSNLNYFYAQKGRNR
jgi:pyocin large subunit-like protein